MPDTAPAKPEPTDVTDEITAMSEAYGALASLDRPARYRAMYWLNQRLRWADDQDGEVPF